MLTRLRKLIKKKIIKFRCSLKAKKKISSDPQDEIREYYLNKDIGKTSNALATIFEESDDLVNNSKKTISGRKLKRVIEFTKTASDTKLRKRRLKIKKAFGSRIDIKKCLISYGLGKTPAEYIQEFDEMRDECRNSESMTWHD